MSNDLEAKPSLREWLGSYLPFVLPALPLPQTARNLDKAAAALILAAADVPVAHMEGKAAKIRSRSKLDMALDADAAERARAALDARAEIYGNGEARRGQANREAIFHDAAQQLEDDPGLADAAKAISDDWLNHFSRLASDISSPDMQTYFARLLSGEVRSPGAFSKATANALFLLSPDAAHQFQRFCDIRTVLFMRLQDGATGTILRHQIADLLITQGMGLPGNNDFGKFGLSYSDFMDLASDGLIVTELNSTITLSVDGGGVIIRNGDRFFAVRSPKEQDFTPTQISGVLLTRIGRELSALVSPSANGKYIEQLQAAIGGLGLTMTEVPAALLAKDEALDLASFAAKHRSDQAVRTTPFSD